MLSMKTMIMIWNTFMVTIIAMMTTIITMLMITATNIATRETMSIITSTVMKKAMSIITNIATRRIMSILTSMLVGQNLEIIRTNIITMTIATKENILMIMTIMNTIMRMSIVECMK